MARAVLLSLLLAGCGPARWVEPDPRAAEGRCDGVSDSQCHGDVDCVERREIEYASCYIDRSRQHEGSKRPRDLFDELAVSIPERDVPYDAQVMLLARLLELLPDVQADIERALREGRVDLATHRADFVLATLRRVGVDEQTLGRLHRARTEAIAFHVREAKRLEEKYPVGAAYHRCGELGDGCREYEAQPPLTAARSNPFGLTVNGSGPPECQDFLPSLVRNSPTDYALTTTNVELKLTRCGSLPSRTERAVFMCGTQAAEVTLTYERWGYEGTVEIGAERHAVSDIGEVATADRPLSGCNTPSRPFATAREALLFATRDRGWAKVLQHVDFSSDRLLSLAKRAEREGDTDRATAAFALLLDRTSEADQKKVAEEWFARRFGSGRVSARGERSEIGLLSRP